MDMRSIPARLSATFAAMALFTLCIGAQDPIHSVHTKPQGATVSIMCLGIAAHHGFAGNQDVYLAKVQIKGHSVEIAKLIDFYPSTGMPIRRSILVERRSLRMMLIRDGECDTSGKRFFLGTDASNIFDSSSRTELAHTTSNMIPCFQVVHDATHLSK